MGSDKGWPMGIIAARKTFSGVGRTRRPGVREPNGRLQRAPTAETAAEVVSIVLAQPHRRGDPDQRRRWAVGRLILDGRVRHRDHGPDLLERAAEIFAADYARYRATMDSRRPLAATSGGAGREMTTEEAEAVKARWAKVRRAVRDCGERVLSACDLAVLDDPQDERILAPWIILSLPAGLGALVEHYGLAPR